MDTLLDIDWYDSPAADLVDDKKLLNRTFDEFLEATAAYVAVCPLEERREVSNTRRRVSKMTKLVLEEINHLLLSSGASHATERSFEFASGSSVHSSEQSSVNAQRQRLIQEEEQRA